MPARLQRQLTARAYREANSVSAVARRLVRHLFEASPRLASETGHILEIHRKALHTARTVRQHHAGR